MSTCLGYRTLCAFIYCLAMLGIVDESASLSIDSLAHGLAVFFLTATFLDLFNKRRRKQTFKKNSTEDPIRSIFVSSSPSSGLQAALGNPG